LHASDVVARGCGGNGQFDAELGEALVCSHLGRKADEARVARRW
jgi:hypothetical protein